MDGKQPVDCILTDCTIEYAGGPSIFERAALQGCRYVFSDPAKTTTELLDCVELIPIEPYTWTEENRLVQ